MPILGIMASSFRSGGGPVGAYDSLASVTLSSSASSITFTGIPSGYRHLQIRALTRTNRADTNDFITVQFNGDTGSNYAYHSLYGNGSSAAGNDTGTSTNLPWSAVTAGNNATASMFGGFVIDVLDYTNTNKNTVLRSLSGTDQNSTTGRIYFQSNLWLNTAAVTSILIKPSYGTAFQEFSFLALYGIK